MQRFLRFILLWAILLSACTTSLSSPQPLPSTATNTPIVLPTTALPNPPTVSTPHIDQPPDGEFPTPILTYESCGYQWAYGDLPELSSSFQESIRNIQAEAEARAYAFGENCVQADGSIAAFLAMETDFDVTLQVDDLTDESDLGEWIVKVMEVIEEIPPEQLVGPMLGRVSIAFQSSNDEKVINFYINQYEDLPSGLSKPEIYQALQTPQ